jgi:hypothetical protein
MPTAVNLLWAIAGSIGAGLFVWWNYHMIAARAADKRHRGYFNFELLRHENRAAKGHRK